MFNNTIAYLQQTEHGESRYWSWFMGFWFIVLGWFAAQNFIAGGIPFIAQDIDPELGKALMDASLPENESDIYKMLAYFGIYTLGVILTVIFWIIHRTTKNTVRKVFAYFTGFCAVGSLITFFLMIPVMNTPEAGAALTSVLAVSPLSYALMLLTFPGTLVGVYLVQKFLHKRSILSLHTAASRFRWGRVVQGMLFMWLVLAVITIILHMSGKSPVEKVEFNAAKFFKYAIISFLFIPLQSATEEIVFRGYLNQGFAHVFKSKWFAFFITSLLFMCVHLANPEAREAAANGILPIVMSTYFMFGFIACIMVYIDNGLESTIGVHAANNMFAAIVVNYEGSVLPTPSLYLATPNMPVDLPAGLITLVAVTALLYFTRKPLSGGAKYID